jgi:GAF domain-containing protein
MLVEQDRVTSLLSQTADAVVALVARAKEQHASLERIDHKLGKLNDGIGMIGSDPMRNIDIIVETVSAILGGPVAFYNRLDRERHMLCTWSIYNAPPDYVREDPATGHICYEATMKDERRALVLENLAGTVWETSDSVVKKYGLKSYIGYPVKHRGHVVGTLCLVGVEPRTFTPVDVMILNVLAKSVSIEEERRAVEKELEMRLGIVEKHEAEILQLRQQAAARPPRDI